MGGGAYDRVMINAGDVKRREGYLITVVRVMGVYIHARFMGIVL